MSHKNVAYACEIKGKNVWIFLQQSFIRLFILVSKKKKVMNCDGGVKFH